MTGPKRYDREWTNDDGQHFYGIDNGDGTTDWHDERGNWDSTTDTPDEFEQDENDWNNGRQMPLVYVPSGAWVGGTIKGV